MEIEEIRKNVRSLLGLESFLEEEEPEDAADEPEEAEADPDSTADDDEDIDLSDIEDTEDAEEGTEDAEGDVEEPEETPEGEDEILSDPNLSDEDKVKKMFTDTGDIHEDYSLSNDYNRRLAKFKFTYGGVNVDELMTNIERTEGVTSDELMSRLSPDQKENVDRKWKTLRNKFEQIATRERYILIHNANIIMKKNDEEGIPRDLEDNLKKKAYEKVDAMMKKRYGEEWVDEDKAIDFLKSIKINFSEENAVKPNLIDLRDFISMVSEQQIAFNTMYVDTPSSINSFIRNNRDNEFYNRSPIFQSLISDYRDNDTSTGTLYPVITGTSPEVVEGEEGAVGDEGEEGAGGAGGGAGGLGGGGADVDVDVDTSDDDEDITLDDTEEDGGGDEGDESDLGI
jgi:hypothetical protein